MEINPGNRLRSQHQSSWGAAQAWEPVNPSIVGNEMQ